MAQLLQFPQVYGQSQGIISVTPVAQSFTGTPGGSLSGVLGQIQISDSGAVYMLTKVVAGVSTWTAIGGGGATFVNLDVTGDATIDGTLVVGGDASFQQDVVVTGATISTGDITSLADIIATGRVAGQSFYASGDGAAGAAGVLGITNVTNVTQGAGTLSIASTNGNNGDNTGFIKFYIGATPVFIPYFATIAP